MAFSVIDVDVLLARVGAAGAACVALATVDVLDDVTVPVQLAAVTCTLMV